MTVLKLVSNNPSPKVPFLKRVWVWIKSRPMFLKGDAKYRIVTWGVFANTGRLFVYYQNKFSGKVKLKVFEVYVEDFETIETYLRNKR